MADPISPNLNMFQAQIDAFRQQNIDDAAKAEESDRVKDWIKNSHTKDIADETEQISKDRGHAPESAVSRFQKPDSGYPGKTKNEQRLEDEKEDGRARKVERLKGDDGDSLKDLETDLKDCRAMYASIEYNHRSAIESVRKFFGSKKHEDGVEIKSAWDQYQKTLDRYKNAKVEELKGKNLSGEDLKKEMIELARQFGYMEAVDLYASRKDAKAETLMGRDVVKQCWGMLEKTASAYNKLPLWSKIGLSAATFAAGAAGAVGFVGAKRALSGVVAGVGSAKLLDALHQAKMKNTATNDAEKMLKEMEKEGNALDFDKFSAFLGTKVKDVDKQLNKQKLVSAANKVIGITVGVVLGSGLLSKALHAASDYFHAGDAHAVAGEALKGVGGTAAGASAADLLDHSSAGVPGDPSLVDSFEHPGVAPIDIHQHIPVDTTEALHTPMQVETISITEPVGGHHDSFMHSLKGMLKASGHVDAAHLDQETGKVFHDAAKEYASVHHMSYDEAVKKLSLIKPGTTYEMSWDADGKPHMHIGDVKFAGGAHHVTEQLAGNHSVHETVAPAAPEPVSVPAPHDIPTAVNPHDIPAYTGYAGPAYDTVTEGAGQHAAAGAEAFAHGPMEVHELAVQHAAVLEHFKGEYGLKTPQLRHIFPRPGILDGTGGVRTDTVHLKNAIFGKGAGVFNHWKDIKVTDVMSSPEHHQEFLKSLPRGHREVFEGVRRLVPPTSHDTMRTWIVRGAVRIPQQFHGGMHR